MFPSPRTANPFETGFQHGMTTGEYVTNRQVSEIYPDYSATEIEIYQNGRDDGVAGDFWRLNGR